MESNLYYNTISIGLLDVLNRLMKMKEFANFRLVGGTALSLQLGHRMSEDIDLFSDIDYGIMDVNRITKILEKNFEVTDYYDLMVVGNGRAYKVGKIKEKTIKVDVNYTDKFIFPEIVIDEIRMASLEEITAMKMDIVLRGGRIKDFWDLHELSEYFTFKQMISFHDKRYHTSYPFKEWKSCFLDFTKADQETPPSCLRGKHWDLIRMDLKDFTEV